MFWWFCCLNKSEALTLQAADRLPDSSSPSHFALREDAGVKSWAVSSAKCSLIHLRLLNNQNELEQKSCHNRGTSLLSQQEHFTNQMWARAHLQLTVRYARARQHDARRFPSAMRRKTGQQNQRSGNQHILVQRRATILFLFNPILSWTFQQ